MGYSIYPKLRAIYSFLPDDEDLKSLMRAKGASDFKNRFNKMSFVQRFPSQSSDLEGHLKMIPFSVARAVRKRISGSPAIFFDNYLRGYELEDIKKIIHGGKGFFVEELRDKSFRMEELKNYIRKSFWKECWNQAYPKFQDKQNKIELTAPLDHCYYLSLMESAENLPAEDRNETKDFILTLINYKNKLWLYRLREFFDLEDFQVKRLLIPSGEIFESMGEQKGITEAAFLKEFKLLCYRDFKFKMYTMRSILAFFFLLRIKINEILSVYRAKLLHLESEKLEQMRGILNVGS